MPKAITYIDLFSGIGGFREGLSRAGGFVCVGHCEIDKYADRSYCIQLGVRAYPEAFTVIIYSSNRRRIRWAAAGR